jgi:hypothetical protein
MRCTTKGQVRLAGPFQQLVMVALVRWPYGTYAAVVRDEIEARTGRRISLQAVHTTLGRLVGRGYVVTWSRPPMSVEFTADRRVENQLHADLWVPNAACRFFRLVTPGRRALRLTLQAEDRIRPGLPGLGRAEQPYRSWGESLAPPRPPDGRGHCGGDRRSASFQAREGAERPWHRLRMLLWCGS